MNDHDSVDVPPHVVEYLDRQQTVTLATASPMGVPHASTYLYVNEGPVIYFWTKPGTVTATHVEKNPVVSFAIDEYAGDLRQTRGIQGVGECSVVLSGEQIARVADLFGQKFPDLSPGATMSISFFKVAPTELQFIDNTQARGESQSGVFGADFHRERSYSALGALPLAGVNSIAASLQTIEAGAGDVVVRQGGPADKFFIVVEGEIEIVRDEDGSEQVLETHRRGDFFGEAAVISGAPRTASVRATKPTTLFALERDTFRELVAQSLGTTGDFDEVLRARPGSLG